MLQNLKKLFYRKELTNEMGWYLLKSKHGCLIISPSDKNKKFWQYVPFILNLGYVLFCVISSVNYEKILVASVCLPVSFLLGYIYLRNCTIYINTTRRIIMSGDFVHRFSFANTETRIDLINGYYAFILKESANSKEYVIWESDSKDKIESFSKMVQERLGCSGPATLGR